MVKLLNVMVRAYSNIQDYNAGCDYALLKFSSISIKQMRDRMDLAKNTLTKDHSFVSMDFWDSAPQYFSSFDGLDNLVDVDALFEGTPVCIKKSFITRIPAASYQRTEGDRIVAFPDRVYWECRPKHCEDVIIESADLDRLYIETQLQRLQ